MIISAQNIFQKGSSELGSGLLELILFIPLAVLLIFMGTDASLRFIEKSNISSMLKKELRENKEILLYNTSLSGEENLDLSKISLKLVSMNESIKHELLEIKNSLILNKKAEYINQILLAEIPANKETGELELTKGIKIIFSKSSGNLTQNQDDNQKNKIISLLRNYNSSQSLSRLNSNNYNKQFKDRQYFIFANIRTKSTGIIPGSLRNSLSEINEYNIISAAKG